MRTSTRSRTAILVGSVVGLLSSARAEAQGRPSGWHGRPPEPVGMAMPAGTGRLRNGAQGMCLDVAGWAGEGNSNVLLWECNNDPDHVWTFGATGELGNVQTGLC